MSGREDMSPGGPGDTTPAWHPDPFGRCELRWWDGTEWTEWGSRGSERVLDPLPAAPTAPISPAELAASAAPAEPTTPTAPTAPTTPTASAAAGRVPTSARRGRIIAWGAPALAALLVAALLVSTSGRDGDDSRTATSRSAAPATSASASTAAPTSGRNGPAEPGTGLRAPGGDLELGSPARAGHKRVPVGGTSIDLRGGPLEGARLHFPRNAYRHPVSIDVSSREITGHTYGDTVNPVTPLITVSGAGRAAANPIAVTIPIEIPDDSFAMAFYHDDRTGALEGLPLVAEDAHSLTFLTRHFSSFFVSQVRKDELPTEGATYFRPYEAGWQFPNLGSFIARGGHCAGMSLSAMWYYLEQTVKRGAPQLFDRYDNNGISPTPEYWRDDAQALRFVSSVQEDMWPRALLNTFFRYARNLGFDRIQWFAFRYALTVTGEPQYVTIAYPDAADPSEVGGSHAMVLYSYSPTSLYVYDPNHPRKIRSIEFDEATGQFAPYYSELKVGDGGRDFPWIGYAAKTAMIDWSGIGKRFAEMRTRTAGDDRFPKYKLEVEVTLPDGTRDFVKLRDGYETSSAKANVIVMISGRNARLTALRGTEAMERGATWSDTLMLRLEPGANDFGFLVEGKRYAWNRYEYVDFVRLTINRVDAPPATTTPSTTAAPPATAAPPPTAAPLPLCSTCPPGLPGLQCRVHCQAIP